MYALAFSGYSGSGKTTLVERLIPLLQARGACVMVIKHAHHGFDMDHPGKDSYRHRVAGARAVLVASAKRSALLQEYQQAEPSVHDLIASLPLHVAPSSAVWVLLEGYRHSSLPKFEVCAHARLHDPADDNVALKPRKSGGGSRVHRDAHICAVATVGAATFCQQHAQLLCQRPVFERDDVQAIAQWLWDERERFTYAATGSAVL